MNDLTEEQIRDFVERIVFKMGEEKAIEYIKMADYPSKVKEVALKMIEKQVPGEESMAENGDISDLQI